MQCSQYLITYLSQRSGHHQACLLTAVSNTSCLDLTTVMQCSEYSITYLSQRLSQQCVCKHCYSKHPTFAFMLTYIARFWTALMDNGTAHRTSCSPASVSVFLTSNLHQFFLSSCSFISLCPLTSHFFHFGPTVPQSTNHLLHFSFFNLL